jgi:hypothetical protein
MLGLIWVIVLIVIIAKVDDIKNIGFLFQLFLVVFKVVLFAGLFVEMGVLVVGYFVFFGASV